MGVDCDHVVMVLELFEWGCFDVVLVCVWIDFVL